MKTILAIIALLAVSLTVGQVYAERSTVEVPFAFTGNSCTFDELNVVYTCKWEGSTETVTSEGKAEAGVITPEELAEESKTAHDLAISDKVETSLSSTEKLIVKLEVSIDDGTISSADKILYDLLVDLQTSCELGIEHGALIQSYNQFELPQNDPRTAYKAIDYGKNIELGKIIKKIEECKGWDKYRVDVLGQRYLDIELDDSTSQVNHSNNIVAKNTPPQPTQRLTEQSFADTLTQAEEYICKASFYDADFKKARGCFNVQDEQLDLNIQNPFDRNPAYKNWKEYMSEGTVDVSTLKKTEVTKMKQESLQSFALQHGIDLADLKNLVQGDKP